MKLGVNVALEAFLGCVLRFCVLARSVRNNWNINKFDTETQINQGLAGVELFQANRNTLEQTGTNLFRHVPGMFHFPISTGTGCSLSAAGLTAIFKETMFRHVPVWWNIEQLAESHERRGFQPAALGRVPDVPDVSGVHAEFHFLPPSRTPPRCPPWPN